MSKLIKLSVISNLLGIILHTVCLVLTFTKLSIQLLLIVIIKLSAVLMLLGSVLSVALLVYFIVCGFKLGLGKILKDKHFALQKKTILPVFVMLTVEFVYILEYTFTQLFLYK